MQVQQRWSFRNRHCWTHFSKLGRQCWTQRKEGFRPTTSTAMEVQTRERRRSRHKGQKNALKREARARDKAAKQKGSAEKKRKRGHHEDVPFIRFPRGGSKPKRGGSKPRRQAARGKPRWFLKSKPSCSSIMQYVGKPSKDNSWRKGLESLGVTVTEDLRSSCEHAHQRCIEACNAMLPSERRGIENYDGCVLSPLHRNELPRHK